MSACTFFGHSVCSDDIKPVLRGKIAELIEKHSVNMFYVGNHGDFDRIVLSVLRELKKEYTDIDYAVVLAYLPEKRVFPDMDFSETVFPEGMENTPKKFAISRRNKWMINNSDYVITYITHSWGGAAQFAKLAVKHGKRVINIKVLTPLGKTLAVVPLDK